MAKGPDFDVEAIDAVHLDARTPLADRDWMSPYVWDEGDGRLRMMVRAVPRTLDETGNTGSIYYGEGQDGLSFKMDADPVIAPGPGDLDIGGCEDPTVVKWGSEYVVYYTGVDRTRCSGQMLYAAGPTIDELAKKGIAHASSKTEGNTKEATIERTADGRWRLFYEFARNDASLIGLALGDGITGPWDEQPEPFLPRRQSWDNWHLSTGPLLTRDPDRPVMFYNGATRDARWRIGWIAFDRDCTKVVKRCIEPLIVPPPPLERGAIDIAFAASVITRGNRIHLYYSLSDRAIFRAVIRGR
jgi:predicted GH43/DUF377 family glycosyl hydrolase